MMRISQSFRLGIFRNVYREVIPRMEQTTQRKQTLQRNGSWCWL